jgi:hypothetical protein
MKRLRFALLFNGNFLENWHLLCLEQLEQSAVLAGVILATDGSISPVGWAGSALMRLHSKSVGPARTVDVTQRFANVARIHANGQPIELDFVLKLGRESLPHGIGPAVRHGIWCFQHELDCELLPFFREIYNAEDVTHSTLLSLGAPGGEAAILQQGCFRTEKRSYAVNRDQMLEAIAGWPAVVCQRLLNGADDDSVLSLGQTRRAPGGPDHPPHLLRFWARIIGRRLRFAWARLFQHSQWNIGILPVSVEALLRPGGYTDDSIEWFPLADRKRFLADPFGIVRGGKLHVLCEDFGYGSGKGHICTLDHSDQGFTREPEPVITLPVHMSYPFLVEDKGEIYCVPETCQAGEIALFRAEEFPRRWSKVAALVERFEGVDPTVFRHEGRWWLTCTQKGREEEVSLWVWHAPDLLGPWTAHARNPVKIDVRGARPAGVPFVHDGVLYRPTQDCSKTYGGRIVIQRVRSLTPSDFHEEPAAVLEASAHSPYPLGRHTLTGVGDVVLIDGHRAVFVWAAFLSFLRIWTRDFANRLWRR